MPRQRGDLCSLCALAETYALIGDRAGAAQLMPQLEPFAASYAVGFVCEWRGAVAHYLGLLAALLGDSARASAHFTHAEALHENIRTLDERIAAAVTPSLDDDLPSVWSSETACSMCHAK